MPHALGWLPVAHAPRACQFHMLTALLLEPLRGQDGGNDHDIGFKEFARVMQAADVFKMGALAPRPQDSNPLMEAREASRKAALKYLRPGVSQEELRKFQEQVKTKITSKYGKHSFTAAFKWIDADRTGSITRDEFKEAVSGRGASTPFLCQLCCRSSSAAAQDASILPPPPLSLLNLTPQRPTTPYASQLHKLNLAGVKEAILDTLCDFIDSSGDGSFGYREFSRVLSAEDVMQMIPGGASGID